MKNVLVAGSTGLIGKLLTISLAKRGDCTVTALVRRQVEYFPASVQQLTVDYADGPQGLTQQSVDQAFDAVVCCIGSTMKAAGSKESFLKVEKAIPLLLLEFAMAQKTPPQFTFISSLGADRPVGFYLETKNAVELAIKASGLPYVIVRPSLLLGERTELRSGERLAQSIMPAVFNMLACTPLKNTELFKRYRPIEAADVVAAITNSLFSGTIFPGAVLEGSSLYPGA